jgi:hypothetical protein
MMTIPQTIGLDVETEQLLQVVIQLTGLSPSEALKQGLILLQQRFKNQTGLPTVRPFEIYQQLDLGEGGYAIVPSAQVKDGVKIALQRKLQR